MPVELKALPGKELTVGSRANQIDRNTENLLGLIASGAATDKDIAHYRELAADRFSLMTKRASKWTSRNAKKAS